MEIEEYNHRGETSNKAIWWMTHEQTNFCRKASQESLSNPTKSLNEEATINIPNSTEMNM